VAMEDAKVIQECKGACSYKLARLHPSSHSAVTVTTKMPRSGIDGVQGQRPATLTLLAKSSVLLHLLPSWFALGDKAMQEIEWLRHYPQQVYGKPAHR